jgi:hypothetical protein
MRIWIKTGHTTGTQSPVPSARGFVCLLYDLFFDILAPFPCTKYNK